METKESQTHERVELFEKLYLTAFPAACRFIKTMGGSLDDARDVFQDAVILLYEKKNGPTTDPIVDERSYLLGICKFLWYQKHREHARHVSLDSFLEKTLVTPSEPRVSARLLAHLEASGKKCLELLKAFYYDQLNMKEIAENFGFSGERSATAQKFKCLEKVRNRVKDLSLQKNDFYE